MEWKELQGTLTNKPNLITTKASKVAKAIWVKATNNIAKQCKEINMLRSRIFDANDYQKILISKLYTSDF